jgi:hypothetical protein
LSTSLRRAAVLDRHRSAWRALYRGAARPGSKIISATRTEGPSARHALAGQLNTGAGIVDAVADDYEAMIRQQNRLLDALAGQLNTGAGIVASKTVEEMADFYRVMRGPMEDAMSRWKRGRRAR